MLNNAISTKCSTGGAIHKCRLVGLVWLTVVQPVPPEGTQRVADLP